MVQPAPIPSPQLAGTVANNKPYIYAVLTMMFLAVVSSVALVVTRPEQDNATIIAAIFGFLTPTTLSLLAFMKAQETHLSVNSRLDGFIKNAAIASRAQGVIQGQNDANARTDSLKTRKK